MVTGMVLRSALRDHPIAGGESPVLTDKVGPCLPWMPEESIVLSGVPLLLIPHVPVVIGTTHVATDISDTDGMDSTNFNSTNKVHSGLNGTGIECCSSDGTGESHSGALILIWVLEGLREPLTYSGQSPHEWLRSSSWVSA